MAFTLVLKIIPDCNIGLGVREALGSELRRGALGAGLRVAVGARRLRPRDAFPPRPPPPAALGFEVGGRPRTPPQGL